MPARGQSTNLATLPATSAALFAISTAFPVVASLLPDDDPPRWLGVADVGVAAALVAVGLFLVSKHPDAVRGANAVTALAVLRGAATAFLVLLVVFFLAGDTLKWHVLLPGLAWRAWLFALALPAWLASRRR